jgi:hypothetical protein
MPVPTLTRSAPVGRARQPRPTPAHLHAPHAALRGVFQIDVCLRLRAHKADTLESSCMLGSVRASAGVGFASGPPLFFCCPEAGDPGQVTGGSPAGLGTVGAGAEFATLRHPQTPHARTHTHTLQGQNAGTRRGHGSSAAGGRSCERVWKLRRQPPQSGGGLAAGQLSQQQQQQQRRRAAAARGLRGRDAAQAW